MSIAHIELILNNRRPHEVQAGVRFETLERAVAEFKAMADRVCTCKAVPTFEINTRNDRPYQTEAALKQVARVAAADQASGFGEVLATIENHRAAGLREAPEMRGAQS